jgi:hypothetical protein
MRESAYKCSVLCFLAFFLLLFTAADAYPVQDTPTAAEDNNPLKPYLDELEKKPFSLEAHSRLARACLELYVQQGSTDKKWLLMGMKAVQDASRIDPFAALPYLLKAQYAKTLGEKDKALQFSRSALYLDPQNREARKLFQEMGGKKVMGGGQGSQPPPPPKPVDPKQQVTPPPPKTGPTPAVSGGGAVLRKPFSGTLLFLFVLLVGNLALAAVLITLYIKRKGTGPQPVWRLRIYSSTEDLGQMAFRGRRLRIGRDRGCDIRLTDSEVSSQHAELSYDENGILLRDLDSSNGTFVNGQPVTSCPIHQGDQIRVGSTTIVFD